MTYPGSRISPEPSRAQLAQDDETYWQEQAAHQGAACFDLADQIATALDRRADQWSADDAQRLRHIAALLSGVAAEIDLLTKGD